MPNSRPTNPFAELSPGSRVSHYEIVHELGRGGMGVVYEAQDLKLDRRVALKTPLAAEGVIVRRFEREARTASRLLHPHIIPVLDVFEHEGVPFLAMEYVAGENLSEVIHRVGPMKVPDILRHVEGLADALMMAHQRGVLHRDIKPGNVLIDRQGRARLADFGLATFIDPQGEGPELATRSLSLTASGTQVGTLAYMSPEQMLGKELGPSSDVYSLGAVIYEMCTGRRAFPADTQGEILDSVLHDEPDAMARFNYALPEELDRIVRKALNKRLDERYQSAEDLMADVRALRRRLESGEQSVSSATRTVEQRRKRVSVRAVVGAALVLAAVVAGWIAYTRAPEEAPLAFSLSHPLQLTRAEGWEADPAISPDGGFVAYASDEAGDVDIWIIDVRGGRGLQLTDDPEIDANPSWFPDGSALAYVSVRDGRSEIWKTPRLGGERVLLQPDGEYPSISPDGTTIAFSNRNELGERRIALAPLTDPENVRILTGDDDGLWDHTHPRWSPDGLMICYTDFRDLWVVPVSGGSPRRITSEHGTDREPVWSPDGRQVIFASLREGTLALWRTPLDGGPPTRLTLGTGPERQPSIDGDGVRMAYSTFAGTSDLVLVDRRSGVQTRLSSLSAEGSPAVAPDSRAIAYSSDRRGRPDLWLQPLSDSRKPDGEARRLVEQDGSFNSLSFSPDGNWLAYARVHDGRRDIWITGVDGGLPSRFTSHEAVDIHPQWSPTGDRIVFVSDRSGEHHLWIGEVRAGRPVGTPRQVTDGAVEDTFPAWSSDGSRLAFIRDQTDVWIVDADGTAAPRRVTHGADTWLVRWEAGEDTLLISGTWDESDLKEIRPVSPTTGESLGPAIDVDFGDSQALGRFEVSRDGGLLVFLEEEMRGDVWIVETGTR